MSLPGMSIHEVMSLDVTNCVSTILEHSGKLTLLNALFSDIIGHIELQPS
jgi:hypothetical protein